MVNWDLKYNQNKRKMDYFKAEIGMPVGVDHHKLRLASALCSSTFWPEMVEHEDAE